MCGWQVKLCDPLVTHESYLSAIEVRHDEALYKSTFTLLTNDCCFLSTSKTYLLTYVLLEQNFVINVFLM